MRPQGLARGREGAHHRSEGWCWARSGRKRGWRARVESRRCTHGCTHAARTPVSDGAPCRAVMQIASAKSKAPADPPAMPMGQGGARVPRGSARSNSTNVQVTPDTHKVALAPNIQVTATRLRGVILRTATWPHEVDALGQSVPGAVALCRGCAVTSREMMPMGRICVSAPRGSLGPLSYLLRVPCFGRPSVPCQKSSSASRSLADWSGFI